MTYTGNCINCKRAFPIITGSGRTSRHLCAECNAANIQLIQKSDKNKTKHYYLDDGKCIQRLLEEYEKHKSLVIAIDFDNTLFDYHNKGHDYSEVIELIRQCRKAGFYIIIFTCSEETEHIKEFMFKNSIPYDAINENPPFWKKEGRKIYYNILLDDRAGLFSAYNQLTEVLKIINKTK